MWIVVKRFAMLINSLDENHSLYKEMVQIRQIIVVLIPHYQVTPQPSFHNPASQN